MAQIYRAGGVIAAARIYRIATAETSHSTVYRSSQASTNTIPGGTMDDVRNMDNVLDMDTLEESQ